MGDIMVYKANRSKWIPEVYLLNESIWQDSGIYLNDIRDLMHQPVLWDEEIVNIVDIAIEEG